MTWEVATKKEHSWLWHCDECNSMYCADCSIERDVRIDEDAEPVCEYRRWVAPETTAALLP